MSQRILLGDEAVALGAIHSGLTAAYGYPGTPSTEIMEFLLDHSERHGFPHASWGVNEKAAYEEALGTCFAGRRALVTMKHVGLNVAADPFMNSALVAIHGGLVVAVADDPGMHSSQNEQDTRWYADFARVPCFEPATQQEAYDMTREAFDLSERFALPVVMRLVTRLSHSRTQVEIGEQREQNPIRKAPQGDTWVLLPGNARRQWKNLVELQAELQAVAAASRWNTLTLNSDRRELGIITTGIARNYVRENLGDLGWEPSHLHIGLYPMPADAIRAIAAHCERVLVLEDGYPYVERMMKGLLPVNVQIAGRMDGTLQATGELNPETVRAALGLKARPTISLEGLVLPNRPPQLCQGCPHGHAYMAIKEALLGYEQTMVTADIGCYTLGALPPYSAIESCVCMGASIGMAKGAAEAGFKPVVAVIGDGTFLHSGIAPLIDGAAANTNMTVFILDNQATAMTGVQDPMVTSSRLREIILGAGVSPEHLVVVDAHPRKVRQNAQVLRRELEYEGFSVIIAVRECKVAAKKHARIAEAVA